MPSGNPSEGPDQSFGPIKLSFALFNGRRTALTIDNQPFVNVSPI